MAPSRPHHLYSALKHRIGSAKPSTTEFAFFQELEARLTPSWKTHPHIDLFMEDLAAGKLQMWNDAMLEALVVHLFPSSNATNNARLESVATRRITELQSDTYAIVGSVKEDRELQVWTALATLRSGKLTPAELERIFELLVLAPFVSDLGFRHKELRFFLPMFKSLPADEMRGIIIRQCFQPPNRAKWAKRWREQASQLGTLCLPGWAASGYLCEEMALRLNRLQRNLGFIFSPKEGRAEFEYLIAFIEETSLTIVYPLLEQLAATSKDTETILLYARAWLLLDKERAFPLFEKAALQSDKATIYQCLEALSGLDKERAFCVCQQLVLKYQLSADRRVYYEKLETLNRERASDWYEQLASEDKDATGALWWADVLKRVNGQRAFAVYENLAQRFTTAYTLSRCAQAMVQIDQSRAVSFFEHLAETVCDITTLTFCAEQLEKTDKGRAYSAYERLALQSKTAETVSLCIGALKRLNSDRAFSSFKELASLSKHPETIALCIQAMALAPGDDFYPMIEQFAAQPNDALVVRECIRALAPQNRASDYPLLEMLASQSNDTETVFLCVQGLAPANRASALPIFEQLAMTSEHKETILLSVEALARSDNGCAISVLMQRLAQQGKKWGFGPALSSSSINLATLINKLDPNVMSELLQNAKLEPDKDKWLFLLSEIADHECGEMFLEYLRNASMEEIMNALRYAPKFQRWDVLSDLLALCRSRNVSQWSLSTKLEPDKDKWLFFLSEIANYKCFDMYLEYLRNASMAQIIHALRYAPKFQGRDVLSDLLALCRSRNVCQMSSSTYATAWGTRPDFIGEVDINVRWLIGFMKDGGPSTTELALMWFNVHMGSQGDLPIYTASVANVRSMHLAMSRLIRANEAYLRSTDGHELLSLCCRIQPLLMKLRYDVAVKGVESDYDRGGYWEHDGENPEFEDLRAALESVSKDLKGSFRTFGRILPT